MRSALAITLPWPPSINSYWAPIIVGHRAQLALTPRAREYRLAVRHAIAASLGPHALHPIAGRIRLEIELCAPDRRTRDLDNHVKGVQDSLTKVGAWGDDGQIDELVVTRGPLTPKGAANVLITEL